MSRKSAQKKRHSTPPSFLRQLWSHCFLIAKPCRYFQMNKCPHSADVCDFAHIMTTPVVPLHKDSTVCRYHAAGRCNHGQTCKYQHGNEGMSIVLVIFAASLSNSSNNWHGNWILVSISNWPSEFFRGSRCVYSHSNRTVFSVAIILLLMASFSQLQFPTRV